MDNARMQRLFNGIVIAAAALAAGAVAPAAQAALPQQSGTVDLLSQANVQIDGAAGEHAGWSVAGAGDVNGDDIRDVIVGTRHAHHNGRPNSGAAYVVFGKPSSTAINMASLGGDGFRIEGAEASDYAGWSVGGAGDVNGDGLADVIVGAPDYGNPAGAGSAHVVFGKTTSTAVDLLSLGSDGFRIDGQAAGDYAGWSVGGAGDVNGDGRADVMVGAPAADNNGRANSGSAYVVFGKTSTANVDLTSLGTGGFRTDGQAAGVWGAGVSVTGAGDVNGDGRTDVIVGANAAGNNGRASSGSAYVVFGRTSTTTIDLASLGTDGFRIDGAAAGDVAGTSVSGAGDVNGDARADVIVGAWQADNNGRTTSGSAYVVFGRTSTTTIDLASLGSGGFRIDGQAAGDQAGTSVSGAGDVNGDSRPDVVVGANAAGNKGSLSGSVYVVFGKTSTTTIDLASLGSDGFRIDAATAGDQAGFSSAGAGDVNGDSRPDVITGAFGANSNGRGAAYVTYGWGAPELSYDPSSLELTAGTAIAPLNPTVRHTGTPSFAVSPPLPAGLSLDPATGIVSGNPTSPQAATTHTVTMTDLAGTATATLSFTVNAAHANDQSCSRLTQTPTLSSVSRWTPLRSGGQARLRGPVGGLVLRSAKTASFKLQTKKIRGRAGKVKRVDFALDGKLIASDRRAPFATAVAASQWKRGGHALRATVRQVGKRKKLTHKIFVADCRPARFSAAMSSKKRNAHPSLKLTAQTYGPELASARFLLPRQLTVSVKRKTSGKRIGTLRLKLASGKTRSLALRLPKKKAKQLTLASSAGTQVGLQVGSKQQISVSGIPAGVTEMAVVLPGKNTELFKNSKRCSKLGYKATLTDRTKTSLSLVSGARVCY